MFSKSIFTSQLHYKSLSRSFISLMYPETLLKNLSDSFISPAIASRRIRISAFISSRIDRQRDTTINRVAKNFYATKAYNNYGQQK